MRVDLGFCSIDEIE
jgi:hypothetical protein